MRTNYWLKDITFLKVKNCWYTDTYRLIIYVRWFVEEKKIDLIKDTVYF